MWFGLSKAEIETIDKESRQLIAETFFPRNYDSAEDLKNYTPTDLTRDRDGNRISGKFLPSDLSIGAPSPAIWGFWLALTIVSGILLVMAIVAIGYFAFIPFAEGYHNLKTNLIGIPKNPLDVVFDITSYFVVLNLALAIPTLIVIALIFGAHSEQELSPEFARIYWLVAFSLVAILVMPGSGLVLALLAGMHGAVKQMISGRGMVGILLILSPFLGAIVAIVVAVLGLYYHRLFFAAMDRARQESIKTTNEQQRTDSMRQDIQVMEEARRKQAARSLVDHSPFFAIGKSMGVLRPDGDVLTPDPESIMGITLNDLTTHIFVGGASGTGKTMCGLKPLLAQWRLNNAGGAFVCDPGKSELPHDVAEELDYLVTPKTMRINMLAGVDPEIASSILFKAYSSGGDGKIFDTSAEQDIRTALFVLDYVAKNHPWMASVAPYSIRSLYRFISDEMYRMGIIENIPVPDSEYLKIAWNHWKNVVPNMPDDTKGSVEFTIRAWLADFVLHHLLESWADEDSELDIAECVATGGIVGVECSPAVYGNGGPMALMLIKEAIYGRIKRRAGIKWEAIPTEKRVLFMMDECAEGITMSDLEFVRIGRSLGCTMAYAAQTKESIINKFQKDTSTPNDATEDFLNQFASRITFYSTKETLISACNHAGQRSRWIPEKGAVYSSPLLSSVNSDMSDGNTQWNKGHIKDMLAAFTGVFSSAKRAGSIDVQSKNDEQNMLIQKGAIKGEVEVRDTITPEELSPYFSHPQCALVTVQRAGVKRREVCDMSIWLPNRAIGETPRQAYARVLGHELPPQLEKPVDPVLISDNSTDNKPT